MNVPLCAALALSCEVDTVAEVSRGGRQKPETKIRSYDPVVRFVQLNRLPLAAE